MVHPFNPRTALAGLTPTGRSRASNIPFYAAAPSRVWCKHGPFHSCWLAAQVVSHNEPLAFAACTILRPLLARLCPTSVQAQVVSILISSTCFIPLAIISLAVRAIFISTQLCPAKPAINSTFELRRKSFHFVFKYRTSSSSFSTRLSKNQMQAQKKLKRLQNSIIIISPTVCTARP